MSKDIELLTKALEHFVLKTGAQITVHRMCFDLLFRRLIADVPDFDAEAYIEHLEELVETFPESSGTDPRMLEAGDAELHQLIKLAKDAIESD